MVTHYKASNAGRSWRNLQHHWQLQYTVWCVPNLLLVKSVTHTVAAISHGMCDIFYSPAGSADLDFESVTQEYHGGTPELKVLEHQYSL